MRPGTTEGNQIDYVSIQKKWDRIIKLLSFKHGYRPFSGYDNNNNENNQAQTKKGNYEKTKRRVEKKDMENIKVPTKLMRSANMTMEKATARVATSGEQIETTVRQDDALSTTLFNIELDEPLKEVEVERTIVQSST
ncbi:hypothetical protein JTB14_028130 [Gonioctena quinquepunctata]|nr:hypothetical protein JTB14_028130 [Gonioctena quinquepunctata]